MKTIVIAGAASGVGKTTIAVGLMAALAGRGLKVQPFKAGPDYIDPSHHTRATGTFSRNLDTWLLPGQAVVELFVRAQNGRDIGVIEGVMGLFDGSSPLSNEGSTAEIAEMLGAPVLLVLDASGTCRSLGAMVKGYAGFAPQLHLAGVILNNIGSENHFSLCKQAIEGSTGVPALGYLPKRQDLAQPERHLGLVPAAEKPATQEYLDQLAAQCQATMVIERILALAEHTSPGTTELPSIFPDHPLPAMATIAIARDMAFSFYYQDGLDLLAAWGAELAPFSPLDDGALPAGTNGLYLGGGFPELYADRLEANVSMRRAVLDAAQAGMPVYAECGGLMYLGRSVRDFHGTLRRMAGVIPASSRIDRPALNLGYRTVTALTDGPLLEKGETVRGHEFHWSVLEDSPGGNAYEIAGRGRSIEGFTVKNTLASYVHLHIGSRPAMARRFIRNCRLFREGRL
ncbi:MAG: cobyrinate a,c-diamide synthase [Chloroflexi bacterium]|nr:cobyrinate a,c-diamide synthase [Chloroflexota bacterium]